mgnify:CR=1 FL=1
MKYCIKHKLTLWYLSAEGRGWTLRNDRKLFDSEEEAWGWAKDLPDANIDFLEVLPIDCLI